MMWVTYNYAKVKLGMKHTEICALETITIHAPNGIRWKAFKIPTEKGNRRAKCLTKQH